MSNMIEVSGLWLNKAKDGQTYMSGYMGNARIFIFKNAYKTGDTHPDYRLFIAAKTDPEPSDEIGQTEPRHDIKF